MFNNKIRIIDFLFYALVIILLVPVWQNKFFVTLDGPAHLYNSSILNDLLRNNHKDFYLTYHDLNFRLEPNWFTHAFYTLFLFFFKPFLVEKILITAYITGFCFSLRELLRTINRKSEWLVIIAMPFVYQKVFTLGFFNCVISYVFFFLIVNHWLKKKGDLNLKNSLTLMLLLLLCYFSHLMGLALSLLSIAFLFLIETIQDLRINRLKINAIKAAKMILISLPSLVLVIQYVIRSNQKIQELNFSKKALYHQLIEGNFMFNLDYNEKAIGIAFSCVMGLLFLFGLANKIKGRKINQFDAFFLVFVICVLLYFNSPGSFMGGGLLIERLQFIIFIILFLWLATFNYWKYLKVFLIVSSIFTTSIMMYIQIPIYNKSSDYIEEIMELSDYIEEESIVLPLNYNFNGCGLENPIITNHSWHFMHASEYLGTEKALVSLMNYEAHTNYFPLKYKENIDPYLRMYQIEFQPPIPDIKNYVINTGLDVDYIVMFCFENHFLNNAKVLENMNYIDANYELAYTSSNQRVKLYKRV